MSNKSIKSVLISVFDKDGLEPIIRKLNEQGVKIYATGGTEKFIKNLEIAVIPIEDVTLYPSILGGRVKTLHPKVFGGILNRQDNENDTKEINEFNIPQIDLVIVDLYPFEKTVNTGASEQDIIDKIDIGGVSLIRAAAKNYKDTVIISSIDQYDDFLSIISRQKGETTLSQRKNFAVQAFNISSHYDTAIFNFFNQDLNVYKASEIIATELRYGENPHQKGMFFGDLDQMFDKLHGKELSYNNLLDIDSAVSLINEFKGQAPTFAILKHNNACGIAQRNTLKDAYRAALAGDSISAFGGVLIANIDVDKSTAKQIDKLFFEVIIATGYDIRALEILKRKKNRVILVQKNIKLSLQTVRTALNGVLVQERDYITDGKERLVYKTVLKPSDQQIEDLLFASKICKHTKSNTIVLVKNKQLYGIGTGQTSRVDALNHAIEKSQKNNFDLNGAVMASDAFFPFPDCVEIADKAGIKSIIQPGGSVKDQLSIDYCDNNDIAMVFTKVRHFKH